MDELTDAQVSRPEMDDAQVSAAPQPDYTNPVNQAVFNQGAGAKILNATFGGVLRPYLAADTAIKEAMSSGFSDGAIQDLKNAGSLLDVQQKQSDVEHAVVGGIMMPTAAVAAAPQVALDYALRAANAGINAPIAAIGAALMPGKSPKEIAEQTPEALNQAFFALQGSPIGQMIEDVRLASSVTEAGIPVVRENAPAPTIQEMMAAPVKTEEGKAVEATAPIIPKAPVKNPLIEEGTGNLNLDYIKGDSDMLAAHGRAAQAIADRDGVVVSNTLTRENSQEMIETAMRENADGIPDALRDREFDAPTNAAEVDAARQIADGEMRRFWALKDIYSQTGDERDYNAASEAYDSLMNATGIRHNISATPGRALQAHQMVLGEDTAVNEALANKLVGMSKEEGMRVTMELPNQQAVAKFALGLKKTAWQSAREIPMFLWYNWLLSGYVSHLTYLGMGMYQAVARTIPESLLDAGVGAVQRKLGYGLSIAEYKALTAERDALKATLEKGGLKAAEGGKAGAAPERQARQCPEQE